MVAGGALPTRGVPAGALAVAGSYPVGPTAAVRADVPAPSGAGLSVPASCPKTSGGVARRPCSGGLDQVGATWSVTTQGCAETASLTNTALDVDATPQEGVDSEKMIGAKVT